MGRSIYWLLTISVCLGISSLGAVDVYVDAGDEVLWWNIDDDESLQDLYDALPLLMGNPRPGAVRAAELGRELSRAPDYIGCRDYHADLTMEELMDLRYIVLVLADKSLAYLALHKSSLEATGDRIDHLHPLRFLMTVFSDDELMVGVHNIRPRGWVWGDFVGGITRGMGEEYATGNVTDWMVEDFAARIGIDPARILPAIHQQRWSLLVEILIRIVPRDGDGDRYDM